MEAKLYEIADQYRELLRRAEDPELPPQALQDSLEALSGEFATKTWNVAAVLLNIEGEAELVRCAEARMSRRRKALEQRAVGLRDYLRMQMERTGIQEVRSPEFVVRLKPNPPRVIVDEALLPDRFKQCSVVTQIDRVAIRHAIEAGESVAGAHLEQDRHIEIA